MGQVQTFNICFWFCVGIILLYHAYHADWEIEGCGRLIAVVRSWTLHAGFLVLLGLASTTVTQITFLRDRLVLGLGPLPTCFTLTAIPYQAIEKAEVRKWPGWNIVKAERVPLEASSIVNVGSSSTGREEDQDDLVELRDTVGDQSFMDSSTLLSAPPPTHTHTHTQTSRRTKTPPPTQQPWQLRPLWRPWLYAGRDSMLWGALGKGINPSESELLYLSVNWAQLSRSHSQVINNPAAVGSGAAVGASATTSPSAASPGSIGSIGSASVNTNTRVGIWVGGLPDPHAAARFLEEKQYRTQACIFEGFNGSRPTQPWVPCDGSKEEV